LAASDFTDGSVNPLTPQTPLEPPTGNVEGPAAQEAAPPTPPTNLDGLPSLEPAGGEETAPPRRRILIGSQRDPAAYRARPPRDWTPVVDEETGRQQPKRKHGRLRPRGRKERTKPRKSDLPTNDVPEPLSSAPQEQPVGPPVAVDVAATPEVKSEAPVPRKAAPSAAQPMPTLFDQLVSALAQSATAIAKPSVRDPLPPDLEEEYRRTIADAPVEELLRGDAVGNAGQAVEDFEPQSVQEGRVVAVRREDVFVEMAGRRQGIMPLQQFDTPPQPGASIQVRVERLNPDDRLYELSLPSRVVQVDDWSDLIEGALVDVRVTGHNSGGLECVVNHIRGFIPAGQVDLYHVENLAQFVDQKLTCLITESNPDRKRLVLSRRAVLEREREEARQRLLASLQPGQVLEGVVRKLMDFGAFVDLGGVEGLVHLSQLAWGRVKHPSEVLQEGQPIKVRIDKVDLQTGKISLAYRDLLENPWTSAAQKYPPNSVVRGKVVKLMDFGAFVELEPGVEGLVHISELSPRRVNKPAEVVKPGQEVEALVLSVDVVARRISLSMKQLAAPPESEEQKEENAPAEKSAAKKKKPKEPSKPLLGGLGRSTGDRFGLKW